MAEFLNPDWAGLVWLAGLVSVVLGFVLLVIWGAVWVAYQTIQANRPARHSKRRGRRLIRG